VTQAQADHFAQEWVAAWNSHDLERILAHYSDDVELASPLVQQIVGAGEHTVRGKAALRAYFLRGLDAYPNLRFTLWGAYPGVESLVLHYESVRGLRAAEWMRLDGSGRVCHVVAHYATPATT
jgi:hypothetical protein